MPLQDQNTITWLISFFMYEVKEKNAFRLSVQTTITMQQIFYQ